MSSIKLKPKELYRVTNPKQIEYDSTAEIETTEYEAIGQSRALEAIEFGVGIRRENYNLYLAGSKGLGKHAVMQKVLEHHVKEDNPPSDWCYLDNHEEFYKPIVLELPAGMAAKLRIDMAQLVKDLLLAVPLVYESNEYRNRVQDIESILEERREKAFAKLNEEADAQGITLIDTPTGFTIVPVSDGKPMSPTDFKSLDKVEQNSKQEKIDALKEKLKALILEIPFWEKETREQLKELNTELAKSSVKPFLKALMDKYSKTPEIKNYLETVSKDIVKNMQYFLPLNTGPSLIEGEGSPPPPELKRYEVNVLVNNDGLKGVPIVYENNPTYNNLMGRIEHIAQEGTLITDFTLIKPGALHRANGGYLILDVQKLLMNPFAWEGLKRTLYAKEIRMQSLDRMLSTVSTVTLEPEAIPLNVKVILVGDRHLYYLLKNYDPEFNELFKATADFSESFDRDEDSVNQLAHIIYIVAKFEKTRPIKREAVARIIEHCSREMGDAEKLSLHRGKLKDLIVESDYWAGKGHSEQVEIEHVQSAIDSRIRRADQMHEQLREQILRDIVLIDTEGVCVGQVNGLSVYQLGELSFGQPSRITATVRLGNGSILDIERETKQGGPIHSKGVMILSSCLANRYAPNQPLPLSATLVFEQNYGGIDGDSASIAEFCALISALIDTPINQNFAVTGSINQHGEVQAIGGVNHKIEGFFDICKARGLSGSQGVIIPRANFKHLMLRQDVVEAVKYKQFSVYTITDVNDALELLMGIKAGVADAKGKYCKETINHQIMKRLEALHQLHRQYAMPDKVAGKVG